MFSERSEALCALCDVFWDVLGAHLQWGAHVEKQIIGKCDTLVRFVEKKDLGKERRAKERGIEGHDYSYDPVRSTGLTSKFPVLPRNSQEILGIHRKYLGFVYLLAS